MATSTYTPIATTTLTSAAASYTFSSIPSTYTDLVCVVQASLTANAGDLAIQFNGDTGANYSDTYLTGDGATASSGRQSSASLITLDWNSGVRTQQGITMHKFDVMNYANSTTYKTVLSRGVAAGSGTDAIVGLWRSTAAITSILLKTANSQTFAAGTIMTLYGIKAA